MCLRYFGLHCTQCLNYSILNFGIIEVNSTIGEPYLVIIRTLSDSQRFCCKAMCHSKEYLYPHNICKLTTYIVVRPSIYHVICVFINLTCDPLARNRNHVPKPKVHSKTRYHASRMHNRGCSCGKKCYTFS